MGKTMVRSTENYTGSMYMFPRLTLRNPLLVGNGMNSLERVFADVFSFIP